MTSGCKGRWETDASWRDRVLATHQRRFVDRQKAENDELVARNQQMVAEVSDLKAGMTAIEERARSELGMIGRNETFYQVVPARPRTMTVPSKPPEHTQTASR